MIIYSNTYLIDIKTLIVLIKNQNIESIDELIIKNNFICLNNTINDIDNNLILIDKLTFNKTYIDTDQYSIFKDYFETKKQNLKDYSVKPIHKFVLKMGKKIIPPISTTNSSHKQLRKLNNIKINTNISLTDKFKETFNVKPDDLICNLIDVYKYVYKYIFDNYLQDKDNKWIIHIDDKLSQFLKEQFFIDKCDLTYKNLPIYFIL